MLMRWDTLGFFRGFTKFNKADYIKYKSEGRIVPDGVNAKVIKFVPFPWLLQFYSTGRRFKNL